MIRILQIPSSREKKIYKNFRKDYNNTQLNKKTGTSGNCLNSSNDSFKHSHYLRIANKLNSIQKSSKAYCLLLKSFLNNPYHPTYSAQ